MIRMVLPEPTSPQVAAVASLFARILAERCGTTVETGTARSAAAGELRVTLTFDPDLPEEGYRIARERGGVRVTAADERGLRYGVGHLLHGATYGEGTFSPDRWSGTSSPDCPVRGIYMAFNFNNWYVSAPRQEVGRYLEDLSLWGVNAVLLGFLLPNPKDQEAAERRREDYREFLRLAKHAGMRLGFLGSVNCGFPDPPVEAVAMDFPDTDPPRRGLVGPRVCPSHPAGREYLRRMFTSFLAGYEDIGLDYVAAFPYDSGGCGCEQCWPWGARGYLQLSRDLSRIAKARYPRCKFILATWCFDVRKESDGEYDGLQAALERDSDWVDYTMADAHEDFPPWPLRHGAPGGVPLLNFPEITMWGRYPWGGSGANPLPDRLERLWGQARHLLHGGFPYSEGIFEDLNKVLVSRLYWNRQSSAALAVRDYVAYEFGPQVVEELTEAIYLLEKTYPPETKTPQNVERAWDLLQQADDRLCPRARASWRWRILYLRGLIDAELLRNKGKPTGACNEAYEELIHIYHAQEAGGPVTPRAPSWYARQAAAEPPPPGAQT